eukprot:COSAG01_NODE_781_length_13657_cov_12.763239_2_plen_132_part_00
MVAAPVKAAMHATSETAARAVGTRSVPRMERRGLLCVGLRRWARGVEKLAGVGACKRPTDRKQPRASRILEISWLTVGSYSTSRVRQGWSKSISSFSIGRPPRPRSQPFWQPPVAAATRPPAGRPAAPPWR